MTSGFRETTARGNWNRPFLSLSPSPLLRPPPTSPTVSGPLVTLLDNRGSADNKRGPDEKLLPLFNADRLARDRTAFFIELAIVLSWRIFENFFFLFFYCLLGEVGEVKLDWKCHCWKLRTENRIFFFIIFPWLCLTFDLGFFQFSLMIIHNLIFKIPRVYFNFSISYIQVLFLPSFYILTYFW